MSGIEQTGNQAARPDAVTELADALHQSVQEYQELGDYLLRVVAHSFQSGDYARCEGAAAAWEDNRDTVDLIHQLRGAVVTGQDVVKPRRPNHLRLVK